MTDITLQLTITPEHVAQGKRGHCLLCPAALALQEHFPGKAVSVTGQSGKVYETVDYENERQHLPKPLRMFRLPPELRSAICNYDSMTPQAFSFPTGTYELTEVL